MNWTTVLTSTVFAAAIAAIITLVKTSIDNKAKTNDAIKSFRYKKLHETVVDWQNKYPKLELDVPNPSNDAQLILNHSLQRLDVLAKYCQIAAPLIDKTKWDNTKEQLQALEAIQRCLVKKARTGAEFDVVALSNFAKKLDDVENDFAFVIEAQMRALLK